MHCVGSADKFRSLRQRQQPQGCHSEPVSQHWCGNPFPRRVSDNSLQAVIPNRCRNTGVGHPPQRASSEQPTKSALSESESASPARSAHIPTPRMNRREAFQIQLIIYL